jgi:hypothetical protein
MLGQKPGQVIYFSCLKTVTYRLQFNPYALTKLPGNTRTAWVFCIYTQEADPDGGGRINKAKNLAHGRV